MFEGTKGDTDLGQVIARTPQEAGITQSLKVGNAVTVSYKAEEGPQPAHVVLEWEGGSTSDMVADAVIAIILQVCTMCMHHMPKWQMHGNNNGRLHRALAGGASVHVSVSH